MAISVGSVSVDVVPSAETFARDLRKKLVPQAAVVGKEMGKRIAEEVGKALGDASAPEAKYSKEGAKAGGAFGASLKKSIQAAVKSLPAIELDADASEAQREIAAIRKNLAELGDKRIGIDLNAKDAEKQLNEFRARLTMLSNQKGITLDVKANTAAAIAELDKFKAQAAKVRDIRVPIDVDTFGAMKSLVGFRVAAAALVKNKLTTRVDVDTGAAVAKLALMHGAILGVGAALAAVGTAPYLLNLAGQLVQVAGAAALVPAGVFAIGFAFGALKVATSGFSDAVKNAFDPTKAKQFQEALAKLSPEARGAVLAIQGLGPALDRVKMSTQDALFAGLAPMLTSLGNVYLPIIEERFNRIAGAVNFAAMQVGSWLLTAQGIAAIKVIGDGAARTFENIMFAVTPLATAFIQIGAIGAPILAQLTEGAGGVAQRFSTWVGSAQGVLTIQGWIWGAINTLRQLGALVFNVGSILGSLFRSAAVDGETFLGTLVRITGAIANALRTPEGAAQLQMVMGGLRDLVSAFLERVMILWPLIVSLASAFFGLWQAASPILDVFYQIVVAALKPFVDLIGFLAPVLGPLLAAFVVWKTVMAAAAIAQGIYNAVLAITTAEQWGLNAAMLANPIGLVIVGIMLLVGAVIYAYTHFEWFRNIVDTCWNAIAAGATWLWQNVFSPVFSAIGALFMWLWNSVINPVVSWIIAQWSWLSVVIGILVGPIGWVVLAFTTFRDQTMAVIYAVGAVVSWLWTSIFVPAFNGIAAVVSFVWYSILSPIFSFIDTVLRYVAAIVMTVLLVAFQVAWSLISAAVSFAWNGILLPIWNALVWVIQNVIAPAVSWLYTNIFLPIWNAIGAAVSFVWNSVLKPVWDFLVWYVTVAIPNAITFLYQNVVLPIWNAIGAAISFVYNSVIKPIWDAMIWFIQNVIAPTMNWLYANIIKPLWDAIGAAIRFVYDNVILPTFNAVRDSLQWLADRFRDATNWIRDIWNTIKGYLAKPINFMIDVVWNKGIVPAWNKVASLVGLGPIQPLGLIPEFAAGGQVDATGGGYMRGPGSGTSDSILAKVSNREFVVREKVTKQVTPFLRALNAGNGEALQAAGAGAARAKTFTGKSGLGMNPMSGVPKFAVGGLIDERINAAKQWLSGPARGARYVYGGGTNPARGMDCSSMQSAVTHILSGRNPDSGRIGATSTMPWGGFVPGINGAYAIGNKPNDHMAATLGGQNVEQHGPTGSPFVFPSRWGADNGYFPQKFHLQEVGGQFVSGGAGGGGGGIFDFISPAIRAAFDTLTNPAIELVRRLVGNPPPEWRAVPPAFATKSRDTLREFMLSKVSAFLGGGEGGVMGATSNAAPEIVKIISDVARGMFGPLARDAAVIGVATGLVESNLTNSAVATDHDSVGVFQQRPSMGWGSIAQLTNVAYAASAFFRRFPGNWHSMNPGALAQSVQRSAFPDRYGQRMGQATGLVNQFGGFDSGGLATGIGVLPKYTIQPERVLSPRQTSSFETLVRNLDSGRTSTSGNASGGTFTGNLYLDSGEFMGKVAGSIGSANEDAARQLTYGRS